jgi:hypothetical protein
VNKTAFRLVELKCDHCPSDRNREIMSLNANGIMKDNNNEKPKVNTPIYLKIMRLIS